MLGKKGQMSEIMTWVVATIIIVVILMVFIYASTLLAQKTKVVDAKNLKAEVSGNGDLFQIKNFIAYNSASEADKEIISKWEREKENE